MGRYPGTAVLPLRYSLFELDLSTTQHVDLTITRLRRPSARLPLPDPRHRKRSLLPLGAGRRTHRNIETHPDPPHLRRNRPPTPPRPGRRLPLPALPAQHRKPPRIPAEPAPFPHRQALRPHLPDELRARPRQPLALVPAFQPGTPRTGLSGSIRRVLFAAGDPDVHGDREFLRL